MARRPLVGIMGGARVSPEACALAETFGRLAAEAGYVVLCGGRPVGVMEAAARGAHQAGGLVIGVLPGARDTPAEVSTYLDVVVLTGMGDARNAINALSSQVMVACEGGPGTVAEIALALKCGRPVVLLGWGAPLGLFPEQAHAGMLRAVRSAQEALAAAREVLGVT